MFPGWPIPVLVLLPNLLFIRFPPQGPAPAQGPQSPLLRVMEVVERAGQAGCFLLPFFYRADLSRQTARVGLALFLAALLSYYAGWARYMRGGRRWVDLFKPMFGLPLPMALAPVACFFAAALMFSSWLAAAASIVLAAGHLYVSEQSHRRIRSASADGEAGLVGASGTQ